MGVVFGCPFKVHSNLANSPSSHLTLHSIHHHNIYFLLLYFFVKCSFHLYIHELSSCFHTGIWSRDIRYKSNLPLTEINKILKNLESKKLIKAVKSVAVSRAPNTKIF